MSLFTAMFFAAQTMNYPIVCGTTAHPLGGPAISLLFGPYAGAVSTTEMLQALAFGDGGLRALGK